MYTVGAYTLTVDMTLHGDVGNVNITITKSGGNEKFTVTGTINRSVTTHHASIHGGMLQSYATSTPGTQGHLTLGVVAAGSGTDSFTSTMPIPLFEYPILVGPILFVEKIGAEFTVNGSVMVSSSVDVQADFDYDSTLGFSYDGTTVSGSATLGSPMITETTTPHSASAGDVAFSAGLGFPRGTVSLFGLDIDAWIQPAFVVGGSFTAFPACQTANATFLASAGWELKPLGALGPSGSKTLFQQNKTLLSVGAGCPDAGH
jgi:hypothetical protein